MYTKNTLLMKNAKESLKDKWGLAIGGFVLFMVLSFAINMIPDAGPIISLIISGPLILGVTLFSLNISRGNEANIEQIFYGFKNFVKSLVLYILMIIFVFLWSLLLIVPGIIAAISYSMAFYIMAEDESIKPMDALKKSKEMMYGYKWKFFGLSMMFLGLSLLCLLTLGIGYLWLIPFIQVTYAKFYDDIKDKKISQINEISEKVENPQNQEVLQS